MRAGGQFCPGILHAVPAKDGLLIRIRVPGGFIDPGQLKAVADASCDFADGSVEITSRANIQLRGIKEQDLHPIAERIALTGLLPSPQHDRVRNIVTSPIAGLDSEELIDPQAIVHELDRRLHSDAVFLNLHPKFSFAIYGGPRRFSRDSDDVSLAAVSSDSEPYFHLSIGGSSLGFVARKEDAIDCALTLARMCIQLAQEACISVRAKAIVAIPGAMQRLSDALSQFLAPSAVPPPPYFVDEALSGMYPDDRDGRVSIVPSVPLGRLTSGQASYLASSADEWGGELRLAPWRGVVLARIPKNAVNKLVDELHRMGLSCDGLDGFRGIAACAGIDGCEASLADVRGDAMALARRLSGCATPSGWTVNFSGCDKQCARRNGATAELVAGPLGYTLKISGRHVASDCSRESALDAIADLHASLNTEVAVS